LSLRNDKQGFLC